MGTAGVCVLAVACGGSSAEPVRSTSYLTTPDELHRALVPVCAGMPLPDPSFSWIADRSLPTTRASEAAYRCKLAPQYGRTSWMHVRVISGIREGESSQDRRVCAIHVGPDLIGSPVSLEFLRAVVPDVALGAAIMDAIGTPDATRAYDVWTMARGFRIAIKQYNGFDGPQLRISIDGCERGADPEDYRHAGEPMRFSRVGAE